MFLSRGKENVARIEAYISKRDLKTSLIAEKESIRDAATRQELDGERHAAKEIEVIREREREEGHRIREKAKALTAPLEQGIKELEPGIQDIEQKIKFLKHQEGVKGKKLQFNDESVKAYQDKELVNLGVFYEDEFTIIKLFAAENDRPKNRWTLMALGTTLLGELVDMPHEYGLPIHIGTYRAIQKALKHLPTLKEIKAYIKRNREKLMKVEGARYKEVKKAYLHAINNYSLEDFKPIMEPRRVSDQDAPIVFRITRYEGTQEYRLYQGFYYAEKVAEVIIDAGARYPSHSSYTVKRQDKENTRKYRKKVLLEGDPFNYIDVGGVLYAKHCRPEQLRITETGNTMFGNWWSISISKDSRGHSVFNRENWENKLTEAKARIDELNSKRVKPIAFNPPEVVWITPIPDELFSIPKL